MRAEETLAHRDLPPYRVDQLLLSHQNERARREVLQDRKRLATDLQLFGTLPQSLVSNVEAKGRERPNIGSSATWVARHHRNDDAPQLEGRK